MLSFVCLSFVGCSHIPSSQEFIGKWVNSDGATLDFNDRGKFQGKYIADKMLSYFITKDDTSKIFEISGTWKIINIRSKWDQLPWCIKLNINKINGLDKVDNIELLISGSNFLENKPPWNNLFQWKGEEGGERYEFKHILR